MKLSAIIEGLQILARHSGDGENLVDAEDGGISVEPTTTFLTPVEVERMKELGWVQGWHRDVPVYDPGEIWAAHV